MPTVKELRVRIRSLRNTRKITAAMQLVASAKYRKAQAALLRSRPWAERTEELCSRAVAAAGTAHPLADVARFDAKALAADRSHSRDALKGMLP